MLAQAKNIIELGFDNLGSILQSVSYYVKTNGSYNPSTGTQSNTTASQVFNAYLASYNWREIDDVHVCIGDKKIVFKARNFTGTPKRGDTVHVGAEVFEVLGYKKDPTGTLITVQVRTI